MTRKMEKKRIEYIDLAKGFLIILVVLNHVNADFYSFHNNTVLCVVGLLYFIQMRVWNVCGEKNQQTDYSFLLFHLSDERL